MEQRPCENSYYSAENAKYPTHQSDEEKDISTKASKDLPKYPNNSNEMQAKEKQPNKKNATNKKKCSIC